MPYSMNTTKTWAEARNAIEQTFEKWGVVDWSIIADPSLKRDQLDRVRWLQRSVRAVRIRWTTRDDHRLIQLFMDEHDRPVDNLRVLGLAIEALRMNEVRGIGRSVQDAYMQLAAPQSQRDPYEVLGLRSDCALEVADAAYRQLAKQAHPDRGGSAEAMAELNAAIETIRDQRKEIAGHGEEA